MRALRVVLCAWLLLLPLVLVPRVAAATMEPTTYAASGTEAAATAVTARAALGAPAFATPAAPTPPTPPALPAAPSVPRVRVPLVELPQDPTSAPASSQATGGSLPTAYDLAQRQLAALDTAPVRGFVADLNRQLAPAGASLGWSDLMAMLRQRRLPWRPLELARAVARIFVGEVEANLGLLGRLLVLVVLAAVLGQIRASLEGEAVGRLADAVVFLALGALALAGFTLAGRVASGALDTLVSFMLALLPALIGLMAASGALTTAGLLHPLVVAALNGVAVAVRSWVFPLVFLAAVLDIVSSFAPTFKLTSLAGLLRQIGLSLLGLMLAGFIGIVAVEGAAGAVADGVALRAAKYLVKAFVPVVGSMFADAAELVVSSGFLVRSGVGIAGLVIVALLVVLPVGKLMALWGSYRLAAALAQPVGGEPIARVLGGVASALSLVAVSVAVVGLMFFLALAGMIAASSVALMLR